MNLVVPETATRKLYLSETGDHGFFNGRIVMAAKEDRSVYIRELSVRYRKKRVSKKAYYCIGKDASSPEKVLSIFHKEMQQETVEKLLTIHLNSQNIIESFQLIAIGTLCSASVCCRDVFKAAVIANSAAIICVHNHPSRNCKPSREDKELTEDLKAAGRLLNIRFLDHIIIGKDEHYSLVYNRSVYLRGGD